MEQLDGAIDAAKFALGLAPTPEEAGDIQGALASALRERFHQRHNPSDLDGAIDSYKRSLQLASGDPEVTASRLDNLGNGLATPYQRQRAAADLGEAIECSRRALQLYPADSPERDRALANLGVSLITLARDRRMAHILDEAVTSFRTGLQSGGLAWDVVTRLYAGLGRRCWCGVRFFETISISTMPRRARGGPRHVPCQ